MNQIEINNINFFDVQSNFFSIIHYPDDYDRGLLPGYFCNSCAKYPYPAKFILRIVVGYLNIFNLGMAQRYQFMIGGNDKKDNGYKELLIEKIQNFQGPPQSDFDKALIHSVKNDNGKMIDIFYYMGLPHTDFTNLYKVYELLKDDMPKLNLPKKTKIALEKVIKDFTYSANNSNATGLQARHSKPQGKSQNNVVITVEYAEKLICILIHCANFKTEKKICCFMNDFLKSDIKINQESTFNSPPL